jgi:alkylation response protein AidB-like acyl-CoA dehydrogenase
MRQAAVDPTSAEPRSEADPLELADRFAADIEKAAPDIEAGRQLTPAVFEMLLDAGFYRLLIPRSVGGFELVPARFIRVIERIARADASTAWCLCQCGGCSMAAGYLAPDVARKIFGPRRAVLAWGAGPKGRAVPAPGGYEVTGTWLFASGGRQANWLGAHVPLFDAQGAPRMGADGKQLVRTLLFPAQDAKMTDVWHVVGLKGTGSDNYSVERLFVPEAHTFVLDGEPDRSQTGLLYRFPVRLLYASGFASVALGIARAMQDSFIALATEKVPHNQKNTLRDNAVVQSQTAQAEAKLRSAQAYLRHTVEEIQDAVQAANQRQLTLEQRMQIRLAATFSIHQAKEVADAVYHAAGSTAIMESGVFERRFRDIHAVTQQLQGRLSHYATVGQLLLGLPPDPHNV